MRKNINIIYSVPCTLILNQFQKLTFKSLFREEILFKLGGERNGGINTCRAYDRRIKIFKTILRNVSGNLPANTAKYLNNQDAGERLGAA